MKFGGQGEAIGPDEAGDLLNRRSGVVVGASVDDQCRLPVTLFKLVCLEGIEVCGAQ